MTASQGAEETAPRTCRAELLRADVVALAGIELGDVPGGGAVTWELTVDAARVAVTDEPLTDQAAVGWARRMLGEGVVFLPGRLGGGYWVATPDTVGIAVMDAARAVRREHAVRGWVW